MGSLLIELVVISSLVFGLPQTNDELLPCGDAYYHASKYTCYDGNFLCPVLNGQPTLRCGPDCYLPQMYSCNAGALVYPPAKSTTTPSCSASPVTQQLSDPPYENYFYSDCHSATQVVVTSPLEGSNLTIIGPRLLVAWPAGNSGAVAFFRPRSGINGTLAIRLENSTGDVQPLHGVYIEPQTTPRSGNPAVGVSTLFHLNASAILTVPILGSIRNIRDFTEGPSLLYPIIQDAINFTEIGNGGVELARMWLDNVTTTSISFTPVDGSKIVISNRTLEMEAGSYNFTATFDYPQLEQLSARKLLNEESLSLASDENTAAQVTSLEFLSYSQKLLAGAWRFLTYFGRDSMIATLLLQPVLSEDAIEAVIGAVLERLNRTTGQVCHEETIGDYATYLNLKQNISSTAPGCTYQMVDTDFYLAPLLENYFLRSEAGNQRIQNFLSKTSSLNFGNQGLTYSDLILLNMESIMNKTSAFASSQNGQIKANLIHLEQGELVGEWRDSTYGIGGGRIPYDVNTALVPAALRSISALSAAGYFPSHPEWSSTASSYAKIWEEKTLDFFKISFSAEEAVSLVENYTTTSGYGFPSRYEIIGNDEIIFHGLALDGNNHQSLVKVMNTDDCFRLFFLNVSSDISFLNQTAKNILRPFPVGLMTPVGLVVANPAYGGSPVYAANFTNNAYHGTVVWSWQLAMMAVGLERQLGRSMDFWRGNEVVYENVKAAYNALWDVIELNRGNLNSEVWSWRYQGGEFVFEPLGALPPPAGLNPTESNVRQLWSLTFLAVRRDEALR